MSSPFSRPYGVRFAVLAAALCVGAACHPTLTTVKMSNAAVGETIAGVIDGPKESELSDRTVSVVNTATGQRYQTTTGPNGSYSLRVPPGPYRVEVELRTGEQLAHEEPAPLLTTDDGEMAASATTAAAQQQAGEVRR